MHDDTADVFQSMSFPPDEESPLYVWIQASSKLELPDAALDHLELVSYTPATMFAC